MTLTPKTDAKGDFQDPRSQPDFLPQHYPRANGKEAPPMDSVGRNDRIQFEFLAIYYELNCEYSRLLEARTKAESPARNEAERERLQAIERVLVRRDGLEDRYAPCGVIAEPVVQAGFTVDLKISFGNVDAVGRLRSDSYTITAYVPVPMPKGTKIEDLPIAVEGPGIPSE